MNKRVYPKEGAQKLKETVHTLRAELRKVKKENKSLKASIANVLKPVRKHKAHINQPKLTSDEWRKDFVRRFKADLQKRQENK